MILFLHDQNAIPKYKKFSLRSYPVRINRGNCAQRININDGEALKQATQCRRFYDGNPRMTHFHTAHGASHFNRVPPNVRVTYLGGNIIKLLAGLGLQNYSLS